MLLETSPLFAGLPRPVMDKVTALCVHRRLGADDVLFRKGDPGDALYGIVSGRIRIHATAIDGRETLLNILSAGEIFGEIALIDGLPRTADATALEPTELVMLRRNAFMPLVHSDGDLAVHLLELTCRRLRWISEMVEDATFLAPPARMAKRLLQLARQHGRTQADGVVIDLRLSQREIGELAGVSRETANKHLNAWARLGWIAVHREAIVIRQMQPLEDLAETDTKDFA